MKLQKCYIAAVIATLLAMPAVIFADGDRGSQGASSGGTISDDQHGDDHGHDGTAGDHNQANPSASSPSAPVAAGPQDRGEGNGVLQLQRTRVSLAATDAGNAIGAEGHADLRAQGSQQRLMVEMEANVPDGTQFTLAANNTPVGTITIQLGEGEFEFESENGQALAGGLMPSAINSLTLTDSSNTIVLQASFGALSNNAAGLPPVLAVRKRLQLSPTALGASLSAEGNADLRSQGADTRLKVELEANVPDGTVWTISANNGIKLGSVTFQLMEGELRLDANDLLQAGLSDPSAISSIQVNDAAGKAVLSGTF